MKILIASDSYKYQTSGVANVVIMLAEEMRSRGHDVKVLALSNTRRSFKEENSSTAVVPASTPARGCTYL